jgi:hypothetical protein
VIPISKDGSKLSPPMGFHYDATLSAADLDAIVDTYVQRRQKPRRRSAP